MTAAPSPDPVRRELREAADAWEREFGGCDGDVPRWLRRRSAALPAAPGIEGLGEGREDELRARLTALHRPIPGVIMCEHIRNGEQCGTETDGVWTKAPQACGGGDERGWGVIRRDACSECMVGSDGCDMPDGLEDDGATVLIEATGWRHVPWPCPTMQHVARSALSPRPTGEPDQPAHGRDEAGR